MSAEAEIIAPVSFYMMIKTYRIKKGIRPSLRSQGEGCRQRSCTEYAAGSASRNGLPIELPHVEAVLGHQHSRSEHSAASISAIVAIQVGMCPRDVRDCWRAEVSTFDARGARERHGARPCHQDSQHAKREVTVPVL